MATGRLGAANLAAATYTTLYTVPSNTFTVATVSFCNRSGGAVTVRLALAASAGTPADTEFLEFGAEVLAGGVLERTGIVMDAGKVLTVYSSAISVTAIAMGIETTTA